MPEATDPARPGWEAAPVRLAGSATIELRGGELALQLNTCPGGAPLALMMLDRGGVATCLRSFADGLAAIDAAAGGGPGPAGRWVDRAGSEVPPGGLAAYYDAAAEPEEDPWPPLPPGFGEDQGREMLASGVRFVGGRWALPMYWEPGPDGAAPLLAAVVRQLSDLAAPADLQPAPPAGALAVLSEALAAYEAFLLRGNWDGGAAYDGGADTVEQAAEWLKKLTIGSKT